MVLLRSHWTAGLNDGLRPNFAARSTLVSLASKTCAAGTEGQRFAPERFFVATFATDAFLAAGFF